VVLGALALFVALNPLVRRLPGALAVVCALGAVISYVAIAVRRSVGLLEGPVTGRYLFMAFTLSVPLLALAVSWLVSQHRSLVIVAGVVLVALVVHQVDLIDAADERTKAATTQERRQLAAAVRAIRSGDAIVGETALTEFVFEDALTVARLRALVRDGKLPALPTPRRADRLAVATELGVDLDEGAIERGVTPADLVGVRDATITAGTDGCAILEPTGPNPAAIFHAGNAPAFAQLTLDGAATLQLRQGPHLGPERDVFVLTPGRYTLEIGTDDQVVVSTYGTMFEICGATVPATRFIT
jgi:hypothetical protein